MKRGFIGPVEAQTIRDSNEIVDYFSEVTNERAGNVEAAFYACAFQAGIDEFVLYETDWSPLPSTEFIKKRTLLRSIHDTHATEVLASFSKYLPSGWHQDERYLPVMHVCIFLSDLLDAMANNSSLLLPSGLPKIKKIKPLLPSELRVPVVNLLGLLKPIAVAGLGQSHNVEREDVERLQEILRSDLFQDYSKDQALLNDAATPLPSALSSIIRTANELSQRNSRQLSVRKSAAAILRLTPAIVDTVLGKLPGSLAGAAAKLGLETLEDRRRVVVHSCKSMLRQLKTDEVLRMIECAKVSGRMDHIDAMAKSAMSLTT